MADNSKQYSVAQISQQVNVLYDILEKLWGKHGIQQKADKLNLSDKLTSDAIKDKIEVLHGLLFHKNPEQDLSSMEAMTEVLADIEEQLSDMMARKHVEYQLEQAVAKDLKEKQQIYLNDLKLSLINKKIGSETPNTLKKYASLEILEKKGLVRRSPIDAMRPKTLSEIVGQDEAIKALLPKIASPFPQHVIIYGPPGVGKTTAARLVLEAAKRMKYTPFRADAPFIETNGSTLRWDPREAIDPLLGSVHDPIFQGARLELAQSGVPEPKTGLVTDAHGGILFIDEIGEMDPALQNKLLKVMEDKRVYFDSSYFDPADPSVPKYVRKLFEEGAPADFILVGATTRQPWEINPALRSRCSEVFFRPLMPNDIQKIVCQAADRIGAVLEDGVAGLVSRCTLEGRRAVNILIDAYSMAMYRQGGDVPVCISVADVEEILHVSRLTPAKRIEDQLKAQVGKVHGLGVSGFVGHVLEFEAVAFPAQEKGMGTVRFNEAAGIMAKDSVANAASVIRMLTGLNLSDYDVHINAIGGGNIDGPSAGVVMVLLMLSAIQNKPIRQDMAFTGEVSIRGLIRPVGGLFEKICGAMQAGLKAVVIPRDNIKDIPTDLEGIDIIPVDTIQEVIKVAFEGDGYGTCH